MATSQLELNADLKKELDTPKTEADTKKENEALQSLKQKLEAVRNKATASMNKAAEGVKLLAEAQKKGEESRTIGNQAAADFKNIIDGLPKGSLKNALNDIAFKATISATQGDVTVASIDQSQKQAIASIAPGLMGIEELNQVIENLPGLSATKPVVFSVAAALKPEKSANTPAPEVTTGSTCTIA